MALQVVISKVSVHKELGVDKDGQMQAEEYTFQQGEVLPDWVSPYQQFVLTQTGLCKQVGDTPDPTLKAPGAAPAPVILPEHDPRAVVGSGVVGPTAVVAADSANDTGGDMPAESDTKPVWEDYAVSVGIPRAEAESMRKADLVKAVQQRAASKESDEGELPPSFGGSKTAPKSGGAK